MGKDGRIGKTGHTGAEGRVGATGRAGLDGRHGYTGATGFPGKTGSTGEVVDIFCRLCSFANMPNFFKYRFYIALLKVGPSMGGPTKAIHGH